MKKSIVYDPDGKVTAILQTAFFLVAKLITREWWQIEKIGKRDNCSTSKILYISMNEKTRVVFFNNLWLVKLFCDFLDKNWITSEQINWA